MVYVMRFIHVFVHPFRRLPTLHGRPTDRHGQLRGWVYVGGTMKVLGGNLLGPRPFHFVRVPIRRVS